MYFVELKVPGKRLSPRQVKMAAVLEKLGHKVRVIDSLEKVKRVCGGVMRYVPHEYQTYTTEFNTGQHKVWVFFGFRNGKSSGNANRD